MSAPLLVRLVDFNISPPAELPTQNRRWPWQKRARVTKAVRGLVAAVALSERHAAGLPAATERRHVALTLVLGPGQRTLDQDNLRAGLKPVLDALGPARANAPGAGLICDDSPACVEVDYRQERGPRSVVKVEVSEWL